MLKEYTLIMFFVSKFRLFLVLHTLIVTMLLDIKNVSCTTY